MQRQLKWEAVLHRGTQKDGPKQRWGHRLLKVHEQLLLFGGFGGVTEGEGKYLNDLWTFDLASATWQQFKTTGEYPQPRSNYTIHFNQAKNQVILFGGGSAKKVRYNTIYTLNMGTRQWRKVCPAENLQAPWERTYHTSEFLYPYLVVFGGEGVSYIDLNDTWVFDVRTQQWSRLTPKGSIPAKRRFAGSTLIGSDFYVIGGCNDNYHLIGDIHKLSLQPLLENSKQELHWQCQVKNNNLLQRWGHSVENYNGKVYIFAGRISPTNDNNDFIQYDPITKTLQKLQTVGRLPKPRRRHSSVMIDNSLAVMGGYNGSYLKDFAYLKIVKQREKSNIKIQRLKNLKQTMREVSKIQEQLSNFNSIIVTTDDRNVKIPTITKILAKNPFFKNLIKQQSSSINLPSFCSLEMFRIINVAITTGIFILNQSYSLQFFSQMVQSLSYFCCSEQLLQFQRYLISIVSQKNDFQLLQLSVSSQLSLLNQATATQYLKNKNLESPTTINSQNMLIQEQDTLQSSENLMSNKMKESLEIAYHKYAFEIEQKRLAKSKENILVKAKRLLKSYFSFNKSSKQDQLSRQQLQKQRNCSQTLINYLQCAWSC